MKKSWPRVIRDPVHNLINFDGGEIDQLLFDLISSREFQRLRRIKQLGLSEMVFPGANHSRFAHSIGVMHSVLAAALLHDIAPGAPSIVLKAFSGENISLQDYLSLDDSTITEFFKSCTKSSDIILSQLGDGILNRNLYKGIDLTGVPGNELANFVSMVRQALKEKGVDDQYYFVEDSAADTPYKPYDPDDEYPATEIYLETEDGGSKEISKTREVLKELKNRYTLLRYFFPEHLRGTIEEIRNKTLLKGAK